MKREKLKSWVSTYVRLLVFAYAVLAIAEIIRPVSERHYIDRVVQQWPVFVYISLFVLVISFFRKRRSIGGSEDH
jgi:hypothetical protein